MAILWRKSRINRTCCGCLSCYPALRLWRKTSRQPKTACIKNFQILLLDCARPFKVGTPRCGIRSPRRADPTWNYYLTRLRSSFSRSNSNTMPPIEKSARRGAVHHGRSSTGRKFPPCRRRRSRSWSFRVFRRKSVIPSFTPAARPGKSPAAISTMHSPWRFMKRRCRCGSSEMFCGARTARLRVQKNADKLSALLLA